MPMTLRPGRCPRRAVLFALAAATSVVSCQDAPASPIRPADIQTALSACMTGGVTEGLVRLDSLHRLDAADADVLATRGLCRAVRFSADSVQADARAAFADLSAAITAVEARPDAYQTPLGQLYNQRGFVVQATRPGDWAAVLADFDRAVAADARNSAYLLDRGVARALSGDTAAARADLRRFVALVPDDAARADALRSLLAGPPADTLAARR